MLIENQDCCFKDWKMKGFEVDFFVQSLVKYVVIIDLCLLKSKCYFIVYEVSLQMLG